MSEGGVDSLFSLSVGPMRTDWHNRAEQSEQRIRELEQELSKTIHERDLALRSANTYRQRMRGWQDGAVESANAFVCHTEELAQENAKLRNELAEIEATTVPSGQYLDVVAQCDKLRAELERRRPLEEE